MISPRRLSRGLWAGVLLILIEVGGVVNAQPPADGFYRAGPNGDPLAPVRYQITFARVDSSDNLNTRFWGTFSTEESPAAAAQQSARTILVAGGRRFDVRYSGRSRDDPTYVVEPIASLADARAVAAYFKVEVRMREHPGYKLATTFRPIKDAFKPGEAVMVTMRIVNVGTEPVRFMVGGRYRGPRDNQFAFSLSRLGGSVPAADGASDLGGVAAPYELKPGEAFEKTIDLAQWFDTSEPGFYVGRGSWAVSFVADRRTLRTVRDLLDDMRTVWQDVLADEFTFERVKQ